MPGTLEKEKARGSTSQKYLLSVAAAMVAELVTFPLDLTKTRLQLQGEGGGAAQVPSQEEPDQGHCGLFKAAPKGMSFTHT